MGGGHTLGERGGEPAHTLSIAEIPTHAHVLSASPTTGNQPVPTGNVPASSAPNPVYGPPNNLVALNPGTVTNTGGSQAHLNMQPFLALNFCIALQGIFPSQN
jgi:microcystin-dependent protein